MKTLTLLAAGLVLAGCSATDHTEVSPAIMDEKSPSLDPSLWTTADDAAGSYSVVFDDGTEGIIHLSADGISRAMIGGEEFTTAFTVTSPGRLCYESLDGETRLPPQCWVNSPLRNDGTWLRTGESGSTAVVAPLE